MNLSALLEPKNEVVDPESSTLDLHPNILKSLADTKRLDWLADPENTIGKVMLPGWCSDEYDSLRDAIDAAMQAQAAEAEAT